MSEDGTVENHTLALLREMRTDMAATRADIAEMRTDIAEMRTETSVMRTDIAALKAEQALQGRRLDQQGHTLGKVIDAVTAVAQTQEQHSVVLGRMHEGQMIIERDLSAIKMRVERIERHTGLVQA